MQPFIKLTAVAAPLDMANIDTDKIIPARFLRRLRWRFTTFATMRMAMTGPTSS